MIPTLYEGITDSQNLPDFLQMFNQRQMMFMHIDNRNKFKIPNADFPFEKFVS